MDPTILRSGNLQIDLKSKSVQLSGETLSLTPTSFELLCYLLQKSPEVISVEELLAHIWQGKVVSRETVKQQIKTLRQQLQSAGHLIESVRGFGYRFNEKEVSEKLIAVPSDTDSSSGRKLTLHSRWLIVVALVVLALAGYFVFSDNRPKISLPLVVAVLPFENFEADSGNLQLPRIIQDRLTTELSRQQNVRTLSLSSLDNSRIAGYVPQQYFEEYRVDMLLEGSIRQVNSGYTVNIRAVWTQSGITVWRKTLSVTSNEPEYLISEIEQTMVTFVNKKVTWIASKS